MNSKFAEDAMDVMRSDTADNSSPDLVLAERLGEAELQHTADVHLRADLLERLFMPVTYGSCNAALHLLLLLVGPAAYHFRKEGKTVLPDDLAHLTEAPEQRQAVSMLVSSGRAEDLIDMVRGGRLTLLLEGMQERGLRVPEPWGGWKGRWRSCMPSSRSVSRPPRTMSMRSSARPLETSMLTAWRCSGASVMCARSSGSTVFPSLRKW
jgi:hypothetical protein